MWENCGLIIAKIDQNYEHEHEPDPKITSKSEFRYQLLGLISIYG